MHYANGRAAAVGDIIEHGQLDAFVALDPETGEVLPPAPAVAQPDGDPDAISSALSGDPGDEQPAPAKEAAAAS